jgi:DNA repair exonuclease SbcCD nuclease subunit/ABC-type Mn2+/Zn2+ transport system ATPase subunit
MPKIILEDSHRNIKYIYHISDIHIRNDQRYDEYNEVFDNLFLELRNDINEKTNESLIVITGDILHDGASITSTALALLMKLFNGLSNISQVIFIAGNHDCNLNNPTENDLLSEITNNWKLDNIYYLKNSGTYCYQNILFGVTSIYDNDIYVINKKQKYKYHIALCHRTFYNEKRRYKMPKEFNNYDYVLLGDTHRYVYMNNKKTMGYAGSLIQQNYLESIDEHGVLKWNLLTGKSKLIPIANQYGLCTIHITNGKMTPTKITPKPHILVIRDNTSNTRFNKIMAKLQNQYDIQSIQEQPKQIYNPEQNVIFRRKPNMHTLNCQLEYINKYLSSTKIPNSMKQSIVELHANIYKQLNVDDQYFPNQQSWKILRLEFSNIFCYGKNNIIDFRQYENNTMIAITGPNQSGKTKIFEIILYCLFNNHDSKNFIKTGMTCSLLFEIGNKKYMIERKSDISAKNTVKFYSLDNDDTKKVLNCKKMKNTMKKIMALIGTRYQYLMTNIKLQSNNADTLIEMTYCQQKEQLYDMLNINIFKQYYKYANDIKLHTLMTKIQQLQYIKELVSKEKHIGDPDISNRITKLRQQLYTFDIMDPKYSKLTHKLTSLYCQYIDIIENDVIQQKINKLNILEQIKHKLDKTFVIEPSQLNALQDQLDIYKLYLSMIGNNGVPYEILKTIIPTIEKRINKYLKIFGKVDFCIKLKMELENSEDRHKKMLCNKRLTIQICKYGMSPFEISFGSAYEKFILDIIFRLALDKLSMVSKANFFVIDDICGCIDAKNQKYVVKLLNYIKTQYDYVIIVSNSNQIINNAEYILDIGVHNGHSHINNFQSDSLS